LTSAEFPGVNFLVTLHFSLLLIHFSLALLHLLSLSLFVAGWSTTSRF